MTDNIIIKKIWQDNELIEINVKAKNDYMEINQNYYVNKDMLVLIIQKLNNYCNDPKLSLYVVFGQKNDGYTPAFSMEILPMNDFGHVKVELDMEIDDNSEKNHKCNFFIETEIGLITNWVKKMEELIYNSEDISLSLM